MRKFLLLKYLLSPSKKNIFIFLLTFIFLFISFTKSFGEENVFAVNNIKVEGTIDLNFSREDYFNKAFLKSFKILMNKILLTSDFKKIKTVKLGEIKYLISSFQILEESYRKETYRVNIKVFYNETKVKKFLSKKNISFSQSENISAVFFPVLFINNEIQDFNENYFYQQWAKVDVENKIINFILPLDDLDDIEQLIEMKNRIEEINIAPLVNKYDIKNYIFALMSYQDTKLNIYLKTNFNNNEVSRNISYEIKNINDEILLNDIIKNLKIKIIDIWKQENLVNLLMPLSINIKFKHLNLKDLDKVKNVFYKISIINNYSLEEFNINNSLFKIYYYGNPKKLRTELLKFGYQLNYNQESWQLYSNE